MLKVLIWWYLARGTKRRKRRFIARGIAFRGSQKAETDTVKYWRLSQMFVECNIWTHYEVTLDSGRLFLSNNIIMHEANVFHTDLDTFVLTGHTVGMYFLTKNM